MSAAVEVLIPTFNEAGHVAEAVASARRLGPVFVVDSFSTDGTQELAREAGAQVVEHAFEGYAAQKNWALENLPFTAPWVFILDADERLTPGLRDEIARAVAADPPIDGYYVNRLMIFMGRPIRHGGLFPSWNLRLLRRGKARYEPRSVHEHVICRGPTGYLRERMLHVRRESLTQYLAKHIRYADLESDEWVKARLGTTSAATSQDLFRHTLRVRQWVKRRVWPRLPMRPTWRLLYMYVIRLGFLDGAAGWHLARLMSSYEYMISLLYQDKMARARPLSRPGVNSGDGDRRKQD